MYRRKYDVKTKIWWSFAHLRPLSEENLESLIFENNAEKLNSPEICHGYTSRVYFIW